MKRQSEALRYLGIREENADEATLALIQKGFSLLEKACTPRFIAKQFPLALKGEVAHIGPLAAKSKALCAHLAGCEGCFLFAATLGAQADLLLRRHAQTDIALAAVLQACAAAMLEDYADAAQKSLTRENGERAQTIPRFSPGYGDWALNDQGRILALIDANRAIGLSTTAQCMLTPTKSITAAIGIGDCREKKDRCGLCEKKDCAFRRET